MSSVTASAPGGGSAPIELIDAATASIADPDRCAIAGVNWRISAGDFWVIGASSDAGKTGLLATAAGLLRPVAGRRIFWGRELEQLDEVAVVELRRSIGFVFEDGGRLFNGLTVQQNIALPLCYHRDCSTEEAAAAVQPLLELIGLTPFASRTPGRINRSWRQRVALARALALRPAVLLLDNPLAGLDQRQAAWWLEFLAALAAGHDWLGGRPLTLAVTCEDLRPWLACGTRFALIQESRWRALGGKTDVVNSNEPLVLELLTHAGGVQAAAQ
ncbi:MAG: ATP-binding cassette domain-containing protein [Verrucomicrobia bacterium]|nr:ATP-binding cassette domain-containing protein [Verrucomicrobiota bacterium]